MNHVGLKQRFYILNPHLYLKARKHFFEEKEVNVHININLR